MSARQVFPCGCVWDGRLRVEACRNDLCGATGERAEAHRERAEVEWLRARVAVLEEACRKGSAACEKRFDGHSLESTSRDLLVAVQAGFIACRDALGRGESRSVSNPG